MLDRIAKALRRHLAPAAAPPPILELAAYRALVGHLPPPTPQQRDRFVDYVAHAHSWYKHLPTAPPGEPFVFYLDPAAACDLFALPGGRLAVQPRAERGLHYAALATRDHLRQFGPLSYACRRGSFVRLVQAHHPALQLDRRRFAMIPNQCGELCYLPDVVVQAGTALLTAYIHTNTAGDPDPRPLREWPEASGGARAANAIAQRFAQLRDGSPFEPLDPAGLLPWAANNLHGVDRHVDAWVSLERRRLHAAMRAAIDAACALAYGDRPG